MDKNIEELKTKVTFCRQCMKEYKEGLVEDFAQWIANGGAVELINTPPERRAELVRNKFGVGSKS